MDFYWIACTVFVTVCTVACIWLFVKAKKEHDCVKGLPNVARYCTTRKTAPIDREDEGE